MGKKSKRRGGGKPKETQESDDDRSKLEAIYQQIEARDPSEQVFQKHKVLVTKRLKVATGVGALDEYRFVFDRLFVRVTAAAESIAALPDRDPSIDDDDFEYLKEASHDFTNTPIRDEISKYTHFTTLMAWSKIVIMTCHYDLHLPKTAELDPLFDRDAANLLRRVSSNDDEPMTLRTMTMVARATIMFRNCDELNEASYRRRANSYFAQIVDSDYPFVTGAERVIGDLLSAAMGIETPDFLTPFSTMVSGIMIMSNDRLKALEGNSRLPWFADSVENMSAEQTSYVANYAVSVGGAFCDHCLKSREDASVVNFSKCSGCRLAHYCSKDCQEKAWDTGHRKHCKKVGCFDVGNLVIFGRPRQHAATVVEKYGDSKLLKCEIARTKETEVVGKKQLRHFRPLH